MTTLLPGVSRRQLADLLHAAADVFDPVHGNLNLATGAWGRRADGTECDWSAEDATEVCVLGAIHRAERAAGGVPWPVRTELRQVFKAHIGSKSITRWSDSIDRYVSVEAIVTLRRCANNLLREEQDAAGTG